MDNMLGLAISIAADVFKEKFDKGGKPYILHCLTVMNSLDKDDVDLRIIGVLHDVPEDFPDTHSIVRLRNLGFSERVITALDLLNHRQEDDYLNVYIKKVATNSDAKKVKRADLEDNSNITRLKGLRQKDFDRLEKYSKAYVYLSD